MQSHFYEPGGAHSVKNSVKQKSETMYHGLGDSLGTWKRHRILRHSKANFNLPKFEFTGQVKDTMFSGFFGPRIIQ